eukprot:Anaeramoba_flamelloidesa95277_16.p1 GENE.a95277_16~~a95277_16.p1  ORF type:complete len:147 (+),score=7.14 a95277_16:8-448(+)
MLIDKNNLPLVAMDFMNDVHMEDVDIINELYDLVLKYEQNPLVENAQKIDTKYEEWFEHTVNHFKGEEIEMEQKGFPPFMVHKGEHDNALNVMDNIYKQWQTSRDITILKNYLGVTLPDWLTNHIQTMDTITAMFFKTGLSPCGSH